ncbi:MAG: AAA family ATPase [Bradyrhizobium sp.]|nr:AAA family ATPase [Bradyrhizobium sp.]
MTKKPKTQGAAKRITFKMLSKRLSDLRCDPSLSLAEEEEQEQGEATPAKLKPPPKKSENAKATIVRAAFEAAAPRALRRRLVHGQALAAIVVVPTDAWVEPMAAYARSEFGTRWCLQTRNGESRKRDASIGNEDVAKDLSRGLCVMGIAPDAALLPSSLRSAADVVIRIASPDGSALRKAIARFSGRSPGALDAGIAAGLDLNEIVAAFRPGQGAAKIAERLDAARRSHSVPAEKVPELATAVEYGSARLWAMDLARDIELFRKKRIEDRSGIEWRDIDHGICLYGRPGLGKTLFAQVLAKACGVPLVTTSVAEWFAAGPGYLDSVIKQMRSAFARASALASPCSILFLDEIDALPDRATLSSRGRDWWMPVVTDALTLLDSAVNDRTGIVVVGATNDIGRVDKALLRPGRLEKAVEICPPDATGALNVLAFHLEGCVAGDLSPLGPLLAGMTGAEIMHAVRVAKRVARHAGRDPTLEDVRRAVVPLDEHPPARLFRMAVHEAAHAVILLALAAGAVRHVTLAGVGDSGGRTSVLYADDDLATRKAIEDRATVGLAARAAERLFTGSVSTGAGGAADSDLGSATILVASLHASFGMRGSPVYLGAGEELLRAVAFDRDLREAVGRDLHRLGRRADRLVAANRDAILALAERLADRRHLDGAEVEAIVRGRLRASRRGPSKTNP